MLALAGQRRDLGDGFVVSRVLPDVKRRTVGPFVFFDYFGPVEFAPGRGIDVRPHPHIGLATVTYLFEGTQMHRDSLGSVQKIAPGDVNWMTAGRFIVHSERTDDEARATGHRLHGIQSWIGLPSKDEEAEPSFQHVGAAHLPRKSENGVDLRVVTGNAYGLVSPVRVFSDIFYVDAKFAAGSSLPLTVEHNERAVFVVEGTLDINDVPAPHGTMVTFEADERVNLSAKAPARAMLLGGAPLDGERHLWWNFVSSSRERMERAKEKWRGQPRGHIAGDDEFIPLPENR